MLLFALANPPFALFLILNCIASWSDIVPVPSTKGLVEAADLIVVGKVERIEQVGVGEVSFQEHTYRRVDFRAELTVDETIKREPAPSVGVLCTTTALEEKRLALWTVHREDISAAPLLKAAMNLSDFFPTDEAFLVYEMREHGLHYF